LEAEENGIFSKNNFSLRLAPKTQTKPARFDSRNLKPILSESQGFAAIKVFFKYLLIPLNVNKAKAQQYNNAKCLQIKNSPQIRGCDEKLKFLH
jgi:hypothetical protein